MTTFTDEQLLNLVNTTILDAGYTLEDFTGGAVQITTAYNHKIINYKVMLYFGYDDHRHPVTYSEEIHKDTYNVWTQAISLKVASLQNSTSGSHIEELNRRMNAKRKKETKKENMVVGNKVVGRGRGSSEDRANVRANIDKVPAQGDLPDILTEWIAYRREIKKPIKKVTIQKLLTKYKSDPARFEAMVNNSISNGYQGLFAPNDKPATNKSKTSETIDRYFEMQKPQEAIDARID